MSRFLPLTIRFVTGGSMVVSSIADARKALDGAWKNKEAPDYVAAARLVNDAMAGICRPAVAFDAFKQAAARQGLLRTAHPSAALSMLDALWSGDDQGPPR
ncbi:DUF982 domain-containing protein [Mesorhizobium sp. M1A.F.Ca.ET.072.01.1.1]|uniref:DUF982 domain-containing protein n=1 Tax=Mesorhizobium sp. M1A.F.Ca.ET.072.01.1.1 TaxID=2496753 RepID=UPI000FD2C558|nr:DUF982 domain-containing protein [Mesorhizobium sp. M1A.F.Ca.ET.072.01.1.1]RUW44962.1 DUF982 domain-containing protein [Mesorhizobium sp. M1A.F.Ca.ET.072.01.1.1]